MNNYQDERDALEYCHTYDEYIDINGHKIPVPVMIQLARGYKAGIFDHEGDDTNPNHYWGHFMAQFFGFFEWDDEKDTKSNFEAMHAGLDDMYRMFDMMLCGMPEEIEE